MIPGSMRRYARDTRTAQNAVALAVLAALAGNEDARRRAIEPLSRRPVMFLACSHMLRQVCRVLPEPLGPHPCSDPICPVARRIIDGYLAGRRKQALDSIAQLITIEPERSVELMNYLLFGVVTAVQAGHLTVPQNPEGN